MQNTLESRYSGETVIIRIKILSCSHWKKLPIAIFPELQKWRIMQKEEFEVKFYLSLSCSRFN
jgi:hypothetical protein